MGELVDPTSFEQTCTCINSFYPSHCMLPSDASDEYQACSTAFFHEIVLNISQLRGLLCCINFIYIGFSREAQEQ